MPGIGDKMLEVAPRPGDGLRCDPAAAPAARAGRGGRAGPSRGRVRPGCRTRRRGAAAGAVAVVRCSRGLRRAGRDSAAPRAVTSSWSSSCARGGRVRRPHPTSPSRSPRARAVADAAVDGGRALVDAGDGRGQGRAPGRADSSRSTPSPMRVATGAHARSRRRAGLVRVDAGRRRRLGALWTSARSSWPAEPPGRRSRGARGAALRASRGVRSSSAPPGLRAGRGAAPRTRGGDPGLPGPGAGLVPGLAVGDTSAVVGGSSTPR